MKNIFLKTIGGAALAILMLATFAQISVSAQDNIKQDQNEAQTDGELSLLSGGNPHALEGVWNLQLTPHNCQTGVPMTTSPSMFTFAQGGTMSEFGTRNSPALRGPGHGVWSYDSRGNFTSSFQFFRFNADGTLAGRQIVRQQIELGLEGNSFTSDATAQVLDVNGNVIQINCSTGAATRFQ